MREKKERALQTIVFMGLVSGQALASDAQRFQAASDKMCEKVRMCAMEQMSMQDEDSLPAEMRTMIEGMLDNMCEQMKQSVDAQASHSLLKPAALCLESMSELSCDAFEQQQVDTPECKAFQAEQSKYQNF